MTLYAEAGPLYGMVCPILISVAVTPGVSFDVPAPPSKPRPSGIASAAAARVPSQDLVFDMGASFVTGNLLWLNDKAQLPGLDAPRYLLSVSAFSSRRCGATDRH